MSTPTATFDDLVVTEPVRLWTRERKIGAGLIVAGVAAAVGFGALASGEQARFTLTEDPSGAAIAIGGSAGAIGFGVLAVIAGAAMLLPAARRWFAWLLGGGIVGVVLSFLCWQISAAPPGLNFMPLVDIVRGTFLAALPLIFGALAGVLCERSGVVNVAIEGQLLTGAFLGALVGSIAGSAWAGLFGGILGGVLISALLAWFSIRYLVDQVVLGVVLNLLALVLNFFKNMLVVKGFNAQSAMNNNNNGRE
jgi:simple sugar transport system permease protein